MPTQKAIRYSMNTYISDMWLSTVRSVHNTRRQVAVTSRGDISLSVYRPGDLLQQHVAATHHSDKSLRVYWRIFGKIFVSATEFCHRNKSQKFCLIWFFATCFCDKILLRRRRFSHKKIHYTRSDLSLGSVAAACCCNLDYEQSLIFPQGQ